MPPETDNLELAELFQADQQDRRRVYSGTAELEALRQRDSSRRGRVRELMQAGEVKTKNDLYHAGVLLYHGHSLDDHLAAHRLACLSALLGHRTARWLLAASLDRCLMGAGLAQVYGTQFEYSEEEKRYVLRLPVQEAKLLDFEKHLLGVPSIAERLEELNGQLRERGRGGV